jgi:hypothetical protein
MALPVFPREVHPSMPTDRCVTACRTGDGIPEERSPQHSIVFYHQQKATQFPMTSAGTMLQVLLHDVSGHNKSGIPLKDMIQHCYRCKRSDKTHHVHNTPTESVSVNAAAAGASEWA